MDDSQAWIEFQHNLNDFGILNWEAEEHSTSVNFPDTTLTIVGDRIEFKTYQKNMNLYLPIASDCPEWCIKGTMYGLIVCYFDQYMQSKDYTKILAILYCHLLNGGW